MPTQNNARDTHDDMTLIIGDKQHSAWTRYQVDSDFLIPADAWSVQLAIPEGVFPQPIKRGTPAIVKIGEDKVMVGRIDEVNRNIARNGGLSLSITGRDGAAVLVDCAAPIFTSRELGLEEIIAQVVRPLGVTKIEIRAEGHSTQDKVNIEPGEKAWEALCKACAARGLWPWFEPDGMLVIGGPDYTAEVVETLIVMRKDDNNNIISIQEKHTIINTYSELMMLGQGHGQGKKSNKELGIVDVSPMSFSLDEEAEDDETFEIDSSSDASIGNAEDGFHGMKTVINDPTVPYYRPNILVVGDADSPEQIQYRAKKMMADARINAYTLTITVKGHHTSKGVLWQPGQRIHVKSELHGIDDVFFLMGREFTGGRTQAALTTLRLKEDGVWIPDAFPSKSKKKKGKGKQKQALAIVDVTAG